MRDFIILLTDTDGKGIAVNVSRITHITQDGHAKTTDVHLDIGALIETHEPLSKLVERINSEGER